MQQSARDAVRIPPRMPRFSANLSFLFNEVPFLERFGEAAHADFARSSSRSATTTRCGTSPPA